MTKFIAMVFTAFFERVNPVSSIANPTCMNITRKPAISTHARFRDWSKGTGLAGIILLPLDTTDAAGSATPGSGLPAR